MDMASNLSILLHGFDHWVVEAEPCCDVAAHVLRALQAAGHQKAASDSIMSIPVLAREQQYRRFVTAHTAGAFVRSGEVPVLIELIESPLR